MHLRIELNWLRFLPDLDALYLYAVRPTFMKSTPGYDHVGTHWV
jgi:hypothetical protein